MQKVTGFLRNKMKLCILLILLIKKIASFKIQLNTNFLTISFLKALILANQTNTLEEISKYAVIR